MVVVVVGPSLGGRAAHVSSQRSWLSLGAAEMTRILSGNNSRILAAP